MRGDNPTAEEIGILRKESYRARGALRKDLIHVPINIEHDLEYLAEENRGYVLVKEV